MEVQSVINRIHRSDLLIFAGDWNARKGTSDHTTCHLLGRYTVGDKCAKVDRLLIHRLVLRCTRNDHPLRHPLTWCTPQNLSTSLDSRWLLEPIDGWLFRTALTASRKQTPKTRAMAGTGSGQVKCWTATLKEDLTMLSGLLCVCFR